MTTIKTHLSGRVLLLEWDGPVDGSDSAHRAAATQAVSGKARFVLLDMTHADYADTEGLRWLFRLREQAATAGKHLRIAARRGGKVWRNLALFIKELEMFGSVSQAWAAPWLSESEPCELRHGGVRTAGTENAATPLRFGFRPLPSAPQSLNETLTEKKKF